MTADTEHTLPGLANDLGLTPPATPHRMHEVGHPRASTVKRNPKPNPGNRSSLGTCQTLIDKCWLRRDCADGDAPSTRVLDILEDKDVTATASSSSASTSRHCLSWPGGQP